MKKLFKTVTAVAVANLLLFWAAYAILVATWPHTGLSQTLGFSPPLPLSAWRALLMWTYVVLGAPASIILDGTGGDHFYLLLMLSSMLNSIIWGLWLRSLIYAAGRRFHGRIAQQGAGSTRPMRSFWIAVLVCGLGTPTFGGDFYQQFVSAVDTNQFTQPLRALSNLVDTNNTGIKVTNTVVDLESLRRHGEISGVRLGMTMQEVVDRWGKPNAGWTRCLHGLITFTYTEVTLGFEGNRLETVHLSPPASLAGGLSATSDMEDFVRVLGAPTSRFGRNLVYLWAGANLRLDFFDLELASIYLERTPSRAEPWKLVAGANPQGGANERQSLSSDTNRTSAAAASRRSP